MISLAIRLNSPTGFSTRSKAIVGFTTKRSTMSQSSASNLVKYLTQAEAINLDKELFDEYGFSVDQLMELAGLSVATAIAKSYPLSKYRKPVICCGPGNNGGDGLVCARHLKLFGYQPTVICPRLGRGQLFQNLHKQCLKFDIPIVSELPTEPLATLGDLIVDSVFGFSYKPPNRSPDYAKLLHLMDRASSSGGGGADQVPLVSVDIPSGWNVETGDSCINEMEQRANVEPQLKLPALKPDCLVSLTAPKLCARHFKGKYHYIGGRFVPSSIAQKYELNLPNYSGTECVVLL